MQSLLVLCIAAVWPLYVAEAGPYNMIDTAIPSVDPSSWQPLDRNSDDEAALPRDASWPFTVKPLGGSLQLIQRIGGCGLILLPNSPRGRAVRGSACNRGQRFAATATRYDVPAEVTRANQNYNVDCTAISDWFTALPEETQSIKLAEADALTRSQKVETRNWPRTRRARLSRMCWRASLSSQLCPEAVVEELDTLSGALTRSVRSFA